MFFVHIKMKKVPRKVWKKSNFVLENHSLYKPWKCSVIYNM